MSRPTSAAALLLCVIGMALGGRAPESGAAVRWLFVASSLGGAWAAWRVAHAEGVRLSHVIGLAVLGRLILFPMFPELSDDGYRYIWDGMLLAQHGVNPYAFVPSAPELGHLYGEPVFAALNSPDYFSVYPPVSQAVFALGGLLYPAGWVTSWYVIKAAFVLLEGVGIYCLARLGDPRTVALYALHPVALVEIAGQGHTEGALVCALGAAMLWVSQRPVWGGLAVAMAGWVKLFPLALAVLFGRNGRAWVGWGVGGAVGLAVLLAGDAIHPIGRSLALYGGTLDFYAAPFLVLKAALYPLGGEAAGRWAALALSIAWGGGLLVLAGVNDGSRVAFSRSLALAVWLYALLSPMQHPWNWIGVLYVLPLLQVKLPIWWLISLSSATYLRYVGLEWAYLLAIGVGWGGALALYARSDRGSLGELARTRKTDSGVAVDASSQR